MMRVNKQPVKLESKVEKEQGIVVAMNSTAGKCMNLILVCRPTATGANPQQQHSASPHNPVHSAPQPPSHTYTSPHQYHSVTPVRVNTQTIGQRRSYIRVYLVNVVYCPNTWWAYQLYYIIEGLGTFSARNFISYKHVLSIAQQLHKW